MIFRIIYFLISVAASLCCYFFTPMADSLWNLFWLILLIPGFYVLAFLLYILFLLILGLFVDKDHPREKPSHWALWNLAHAVPVFNDLARVRVHTSGLEKIPKDKKVLYVSNHLSNFDNLAILAALHDSRMLYISKPGNFHMPVAGVLITLGGYLCLDRDNAFEGVKTIRKAANYLKNNQYSIGVCPEGTRSKDHDFHEFHNGSFKIALWGEAPIVIMCIQNTWAVSKRYPWRSTHVYLDIVEVLEYEKFKDWKTNEISDYCHKLIEKHLEENKNRDYRFKKKPNKD